MKKSEKGFGHLTHKSIISFRIAFILLIFIVLHSCDRAEIDTELPRIYMSEPDHFPLPCDTVYAGEAFVFRALFTDNQELGAFSIDIHHNFDHHSHSTEFQDCPLDLPRSAPSNVFLFIRSWKIPDGLSSYEAEAVIEIPADIEPGDYHFFISLTDKEGWQAIRGTGLKILARD